MNKSFVIADIPGLIEEPIGAGFGLDFYAILKELEF